MRICSMRPIIVAVVALVMTATASNAQSLFVRVESPVRPLFEVTGQIALPKQATPAESSADYRQRAIDETTQRFLEDTQWWPMLVAASGSARNTPGPVRAGDVFASIPVAFREVGRVKEDVIAAPVFGRRFRMFSAGTEVWKQYFVLYYNDTRDRVNVWCGRRSPPDEAMKPELTCFMASDSDWTGAFAVAGSPYFSSSFVKHIELADRAKPEVELQPSIAMPPVTLTLTYRGWTRQGPTVSAEVLIDGMAVQVENMREVAQDEQGFLVRFLDGAYRIAPGANAQRATVELISPVTRYDPTLIEVAARASATRAVDAELAQRAERAARRARR
jgi:hypothetical protein